MLAYLIRNGSERVVTSAREHIYDLRSLENYHFIGDFPKLNYIFHILFVVVIIMYYTLFGIIHLLISTKKKYVVVLKMDHKVHCNQIFKRNKY